jgi:type III secretion system low calcium response chaperone LcrH/SycD
MPEVNDVSKISQLTAEEIDKNAGEFIKKYASLIDSGYTIADLMGITEEQMEALYSLAYQNYVTKNYEDALKVFRVLVLYDQTEQKFTMGLAATYQELGQYEKAAEIYATSCVQSGLKDPEPMYFSGICLLKAGKRSDAIAAFKSLDSMGREGNANDDRFKAKGKNLLKVIETVKEL